MLIKGAAEARSLMRKLAIRDVQILNKSMCSQIFGHTNPDHSPGDDLNMALNQFILEVLQMFGGVPCSLSTSPEQSATRLASSYLKTYTGITAKKK